MYNNGMTLGQVMDNPTMKAVVLKHLPNVESHPQYYDGRMYTLNEIKYNVPMDLQQKIEAAIEELRTLT
jgi:hypothetical protein